MASVRIDSGPPDANDRPYNIPKNKWFFLFQEKRSFIVTHIAYDCRCLLEFVQDAEIMWQELKFTSAQDMIINGYELDPLEVELALEWLKIKDPDDAVRYEVAVKSGREIRQERNEKIRELRAEGKTQQEIAEVVGVSQKQISNVLEVNCTQVQKTSKETQTEIAIRNGIHRNTQCRIDKIRTINSTIADQCEAKNITVAKAERIVGIAPTPLEIAIKAYNRLTDADKEKFADYIRNETTIDN